MTDPTGIVWDDAKPDAGVVWDSPPQSAIPTGTIPTFNGSAIAPGVGERAGQVGRVLVKALASPFTLAARAANKVGLPQNDLEQRVENLAGSMAPAPTDATGQFIESAAKVAPAFALPTSLPFQIGGNALIGAIEAPKGEEASGAAWGGGFGAVGPVLARTLGGLVRPTAEARTLMDAGVPLTPGQAAGAGTWQKRGEEYLASNPVAATFIRPAQKRAVEQANVAAAQSVADQVQKGVKLGLPPREAIEQTRDLIGKTYDSALEGLQVPGFVPHTELTQKIAGIAADHPMVEQSQVDTMRRFVDQRMAQMIQNNNGILDGPMLKQLDSELGQHIRRLYSSTTAADKTAAPAWSDLQQSVRDVMDFAQGDPAKAAQLQAANASYRQLLAIEKALRPDAQSFTPRQLQRQLVKANISGKPLNEIADAMQATLPNSVPDSGTAERFIANTLPGLLFAGGAGAQGAGWDTLGTGAMAAGILGSRTGARLMTGGLPGQAMIAAALRRTVPGLLQGTRNNE